VRRRSFITLLGGAAAWPIAARGQQPNRVRRVAVLVGGLAADDPEWQSRGTAFVRGLQELGWSEGRNVRIEYRWGLNDQERARKAAAELAAFNPDVLLAAGTPAIEPLRAGMPNLPLIFANVLDPVANGFVQSLARPGGNITEFMNIEFGVSAKSLELTQVQRAPIIGLAARYRLPAVYSFRRFVVEGGLVSFGIDQAEPFRLAAGYVDRVLKGEKPGELPVQAPTRLETVLNLKTAKALGLDVPSTVLARADEVIE
jgi:putative ABC transport system substrate-binding protein